MAKQPPGFASLKSIALLGYALAGLLACDMNPEFVDARRYDLTDPFSYVLDDGQLYARTPCKVNAYKAPPYARGVMALTSAAQTPNLSAHPALQELKKTLPAFVELLTDEDQVSSAVPGSYHLDLGFAVGGIKLCDYQARLHVVPGSPPFIKGQVPTQLPPFNAANLPAWQDDSEQWIRQAAASLQRRPEKLYAFQSDKCLRVREQAYEGTWLVNFFADHLPYQAEAAKGKLTSVRPQYFHATGSARVFKDNTLSGSMVDVPLEHMQDSGYLCSDYLTTRVPRFRVPAHSPGLVFNFPPEDKRFQEVSAFTTLSLMWNWYLKKNPENWARSQIEIVIAATPAGESGGPFYANPVITRKHDRPVIYASDLMREYGTNALLLKNLTTDFEALAHELGHHIIFQWITYQEEHEHSALHEGLPDFFVFVYTKNPCLGESICEPGSSVCVPDSSCLRTAENDLVFNSKTYNETPGGHFRSQLITGFLWDLHKKDGIDLDKVGDLVYSALPFMDAKTSYRDFLEALLKADETYNKNANQCTIFKRARQRGFGGILPTINCP